jgi:predicted peptidase
MNVRVLAWVTVAACAVAALRADEKPAGGTLQEKQFEKEITVKVKLDYLLYLPKSYDKEKAWPLVLFLHGAGDKLARIKRWGLAQRVEEKGFPCIMVSPQSPGRGWDPRSLGALLDDVAAKYKVDRERIYVTGLSMGGFGTWTLAAAYPEKFAAIVPICGGGNPADAKKLKGLPIWVFHGAKDRVVPAARSQAMVKALEAAGAKGVKFTLYPDAEHDSWTKTYNDPAVWKWLFEQKRAAKKE